VILQNENNYCEKKTGRGNDLKICTQDLGVDFNKMVHKSRRKSFQSHYPKNTSDPLTPGPIHDCEQKSRSG
jgi:hypothetical protein